MKCQKCEKNEVNFHYSSNVNGYVTETHLCSGCATESGYDIDKMFDFENIFGGMLPMRRRVGGFLPVAIPVIEAGAMFPFTFRPRAGMIEKQSTCGCGCSETAQGKIPQEETAQGETAQDVTAKKEAKVEVDEKMSKLRELNMQMRTAVEKEEFERAAELRDEIKALKA